MTLSLATRRRVMTRTGKPVLQMLARSECWARWLQCTEPAASPFLSQSSRNTVDIFVCKGSGWGAAPSLAHLGLQEALTCISSIVSFPFSLLPMIKSKSFETVVMCFFQPWVTSLPLSNARGGRNFTGSKRDKWSHFLLTHTLPQFFKTESHCVDLGVVFLLPQPLGCSACWYQRFKVECSTTPRLGGFFN